MSRFLTTGIAFVILIFLALYSLYLQPAAPEAAGRKRIASIDTALVRGFILEHGHIRIKAEMDDALGWQLLEPVNDKASHTGVMNFLVSVRAMMPARSLGTVKTDMDEYGLDKGILRLNLSFSGSDEDMIIVMGSITPDGQNRYMSVNNMLSTVSSHEVQALFADIHDLRDNRLLRAAADSIEFVEIKWPEGMKYHFSRSENGWFFCSMNDHAPADRGVLEGIIAALTAVETSLIADSETSLIADSETHMSTDEYILSVSLKDVYGDIHDFKVLDSSDNRLLLKSRGDFMWCDTEIMNLFARNPLFYYDRIALRIASDTEIMKIVRPDGSRLTARRNAERRWIMTEPENHPHNPDGFHRHAATCFTRLLTVSTPGVIWVPDNHNAAPGEKISTACSDDTVSRDGVSDSVAPDNVLSGIIPAWAQLNLENALTVSLPEHGISLNMYRDEDMTGYLSVNALDKNRARQALKSDSVSFRNNWLYLMPEGLQGVFDNLMRILNPHGN